jgi:hypothetical protein
MYEGKPLSKPEPQPAMNSVTAVAIPSFRKTFEMSMRANVRGIGPPQEKQDVQVFV